MVIANYLERNVWGPRRERLREEARAEEREELEEFIAPIRDWNRRRLDAKAKGEPFDEPLPLDDGTDSEDDTS